MNDKPESTYIDYIENMPNKHHLCFPSAFIHLKLIEVDFILNSILESEYSGEFFNQVRDKDSFIISILKTQVTYEESVCENGHNLEHIINKIIKFYCNIFLRRLSEFKTDQIKAAFNFRKLLVFSDGCTGELMSAENYEF